MGLLDWQCGDCRGLQWRLSFRFSCTNFSFILFSFLFLYSTQTISSFFLTFHAFTTIVFYAHANQKWINWLGRKMIFLELSQTCQSSNKHRRYAYYHIQLWFLFAIYSVCYTQAVGQLGPYIHRSQMHLGQICCLQLKDCGCVLLSYMNLYVVAVCSSM